MNISIIIITFNDYVGLVRTLRSIKGLRPAETEVIVVNGGSCDPSHEAVLQSDEVSIYIQEEDEGIFDAWNKGILAANGEFIAILNGGDTLDLNAFHSNVSKLKRHMINCFPIDLMAVDGAVKLKTMVPRPDKVDQGMHIPHMGAIVPKSIYTSIGLYRNLNHSMDYEFFLRAWHSLGQSAFYRHDEVIGRFYLGGQSDVQYVEAFRQNMILQIEYDQHRLVCYIRFIKRVVIHRAFYFFENLRKFPKRVLATIFG